MVTALNSVSIMTSSIAQKSTYNYDLAMRQQSLQDAMKKKFYPGNDINQFITALNKVYMIHVIRTCHLSQLGRRIHQGCPRLARPRHISADGRFQTRHIYFWKTEDLSCRNPWQPDDKFQYLSRAWDLQPRDGEKLTDFAGRLKNTIREATVNIKNKYKKDNKVDLTVNMVFLIMGAMLISENVKDWNPNIYPHLVKTVDSHYTAIGIAC